MSPIRGSLSSGSASASTCRTDSFTRRMRSLIATPCSLPHLEDEGPRLHLALPDLVRRQQRRLRLLSCRLAPRMDLGERLACGDRLPALAQADDSDGVVDRLPGDLPPRAQLHGRDGDLPRPKPVDVASCRRYNLPY